MHMYEIRQLGPNQRPSDGVIIARGTEAEMDALYMEIWEPGRFAMCWTCSAKEPRKLTKASLASYRKKRLMTSLKKKFPLIAEELYEAELKNRPQFFEGES